MPTLMQTAPIEIFLGDTPSFTWGVYLPQGGPTPYTSPTGRFLVTKDIYQGPDLILKSALTMTKDASGLWSLPVSLTQADTSVGLDGKPMPLGQWVYEVQVFDAGGVRNTIAMGYANIRATR